jgi:hypothetical protein
MLGLGNTVAPATLTVPVVLQLPVNSVIVTVYTPGVFTVICCVFPPLLQLYVTFVALALAVNCTVFPPGKQLIPNVLLLLIVSVGGTLLPFTCTVNTPLLQPVSVFVICTVYIPAWFTITLG